MELVAIVKPLVVNGLLEVSLLLSGRPQVGPKAILITAVETIGLKIELCRRFGQNLCLNMALKKKHCDQANGS